MIVRPSQFYCFFSHATEPDRLELSPDRPSRHDRRKEAGAFVHHAKTGGRAFSFVMQRAACELFFLSVIGRDAHVRICVGRSFIAQAFRQTGPDMPKFALGRRSGCLGHVGCAWLRAVGGLRVFLGSFPFQEFQGIFR